MKSLFNLKRHFNRACKETASKKNPCIYCVVLGMIIIAIANFGLKAIVVPDYIKEFSSGVGTGLLVVGAILLVKNTWIKKLN